MKNKKLMIEIALGVIGAVFVFYMAAKVVPKLFVTWTKAAPSSKVSLTNSYMIGADILAEADGKDECEVNVFVVDKNSKGVKGIRVELIGMGETMEAMSDNEGKANFKMVSTKEGQFALSASVGGSPLERSIKVTFRN